MYMNPSYYLVLILLQYRRVSFSRKFNLNRINEKVKRIKIFFEAEAMLKKTFVKNKFSSKSSFNS